MGAPPIPDRPESGVGYGFAFSAPHFGSEGFGCLVLGLLLVTTSAQPLKIVQFMIIAIADVITVSSSALTSSNCFISSSCLRIHWSFALIVRSASHDLAELLPVLRELALAS